MSYYTIHNIRHVIENVKKSNMFIRKNFDVFKLFKSRNIKL